MPFLEISINKTIEKKHSVKELTEMIGLSYKKLYGQNVDFRRYGNKLWIHVEFSSKKEFEQLYESSYNMYVYLFDNFLQKYPQFPQLFEQNQQNINPNQNYIVLEYRSDYLLPLRRYFGFTSRVNQMFGSHIVNEEITTGFLRFVHRKVDFEHLLQPVQTRENWMQLFQLRKVSSDHPLILKFFEAFEEWKKLENYVQKKE